MKFRLTYAGPLWGASKNKTRAEHKHAIRMAFHPQLNRLWQQSAVLRTRNQERVPLEERLAEKYELGGIGFIPLVTSGLSLHCSLDILLLRPGRRGAIIQGGDIDNRLKTLFDGLRRPLSDDELAGSSIKTVGPKIYCLLEDDSLIDNVSIETGDLLEPVDGSEIKENDVRLVITVNVFPHRTGMGNIDFIGVS